MRKIISLVLMLPALVAGAQSFSETLDQKVVDYEAGKMNADDFTGLVLTSDPEFEWMQFDEKTGKAMLTKKGLELESKKDGSLIFSCCDLPVNVVDDDFSVIFSMNPDGFSDDKPFGIVYDYENDRNFKALLIFKKGFQLVEMAKGEMSVSRKGVYKAKNKKSMLIGITKENGKLVFSINSLPLATLKKVDLTNSSFGFIVGNKAKLTCNYLAYAIAPRDDSDAPTAD